MPEQTFAFDDLKRILVDRAGIPEEDISDDPNARFDDMDVDSLAFVEIQLAVQQEFGFTVSDEDAENIETVGAAIEYVNRRLAEEQEV